MPNLTKGDPSPSFGSDELLTRLSDEDQLELADMLDRYLAGLQVGKPPEVETLVQDREHLRGPLEIYIRQMRDLQQVVVGLDVDPQEYPLDLSLRGLSSNKHAAAPEPSRRRLNASMGRSLWDDDLPVRESTSALPSTGPHARLGDYHLIAEIGRGGMGIVYRARQLSLGRDVAIKTLPFASVLDPKQIKRFQNEAQAAGQLHHPNIVPVYAVGCERGVHYYSMQLIEGLSLDRVIEDLRSGQTPDSSAAFESAQTPVAPGARVRQQTTVVQSDDPESSYQQRASQAETTVGQQSVTFASVRNRRHIESIVRLVIQAAEALHYAHQCGVIHRDIKPSNLMIDHRSNLWITDFGLARCQETTPLSVTGDLMGTLRYMSPEQASGRVHAVDHRTDIYALGITLYELLTLKFAYDAPNRLNLIALINEGRVTSPRKLNPAIPVDLETILLKAINREPLERYESAEAFAQDLQRFQRGEQPLARRMTMVCKSVKWISRHQSTFVALAGLVSMVVVGLMAATLVIDSHRKAAIAANDRAEVHLIHSHKAVRHFGSLVVDRLEEEGEAPAVAQEVLGELQNYYVDFIRYAQTQPDMLLAYGEAHQRLADVFVRRGDLAQALANLEIGLTLFHQQLEQAETPECLSLVASTHTEIASVLFELEETDRWKVHLVKAIRAQQRATQLDRSSGNMLVALAQIFYREGDLWERAGDEVRATAAWIRSIDLIDECMSKTINDSTIEECQELLAIGGNDLATMLSQDSPERSSRLFGRAIEAAEKLRSTHPDSIRYRVQVARLQYNVALLKVQMKDWPVAEQHLMKATEVWQQLSGAHPRQPLYRDELIVCLNQLGQLRMGQHQWEIASKPFDEANKLLSEVVGTTGTPEQWSDLAGVQNNLGLCCEHQADSIGAAKWYQSAIKNQRAALRLSMGNLTFLKRLKLHEENLERVRASTVASTIVPIRN